ncbi:MAG TPA: pantoate--beta-alanine ligase [Nevskia sp.]|nr:pantoate--beta-alanine ligase [Nevskia sp.]
MRTLHRVADLQAELAEWRSRRESIALVPTMGNLHAGHLSLVRKARELGECVVVSVFVNPLQFGPNEDFERYPRTLQADQELLAGAGADLLFAPAVADVYPAGYPPATTVRVGGALTGILDGHFRPGHFEGVATVVNILFNLVRPDVAVFGEKDWQQLQVIRRMAADLGMPLRIVGAETLRDADGLALSSRNQYLDAQERALAPRLQAALRTIAAAIEGGRRDYEALCAEQWAQLEAAGFKPQYLEVRAPDLAQPAPDARSLVLLAAAYLGRTRLIDNLPLHLEN